MRGLHERGADDDSKQHQNQNGCHQFDRLCGNGGSDCWGTDFSAQFYQTGKRPIAKGGEPAATHAIKEKIHGIQNTTIVTVEDIDAISTVINQINEIVSMNAVAIEEQSATTKEIAGNIAQSSNGVQDVNQNVAQISTVSKSIAGEISETSLKAEKMAQSSTELNQGAVDLRNLSQQLGHLVSRFKV